MVTLVHRPRLAPQPSGSSHLWSGLRWGWRTPLPEHALAGSFFPADSVGNISRRTTLEWYVVSSCCFPIAGSSSFQQWLSISNYVVSGSYFKWSSMVWWAKLAGEAVHAVPWHLSALVPREVWRAFSRGCTHMWWLMEQVWRGEVGVTRAPAPSSDPLVRNSSAWGCPVHCSLGHLSV